MSNTKQTFNITFVNYGSVKYYIYFGISGMLSSAITHTAVIPLVLAPTLIDYSLEGFEKFAFYEILKIFHGEIFVEENV
ncbi:unnamed protein product [Rotaria sp. Silwood2]|nr:unnamed protein product [Rotaria sp. Silwood2]CAF4041224.1 unnamed protein product [Rotaria sp. Silwood2]